MAEVRPFRLTIRARLALTYSGLLVGSSALLLGFIYFALGVLPSYAFSSASVTLLDASTTAMTTLVPAQPEWLRSEVDYDAGFAATAATPGIVVASRDDLQQLYLWVAAGMLALLAAVGSWAGWALAGRVLQPLHDIGVAARRAARGRFDHRLALTGPRDEVTDLADTFDEMLGELEGAFHAHRRFAANASHELQTPLATTRTMLDVAIGAHPAASERAMLERLRLVNERSIAAVEALLDLSQLERGGPVETAPVRLDRLVAEVLVELAPEAAEAGIRVRRELAPATVAASAPLLRQLVLNLVQNAIRHNRAGGEVVVAVGPADAPATDAPAADTRAARLRVGNTGPVVPEDAVAALTEPFFRGPGRVATGGQQGRGLGLSIVAAIAERHGAELVLAARGGGGLEVELRLPGA
ncbi:HAMP domain-containing histidine kinase [Agromyces mediolanus]|uniref:sensor histidine kinase n=1 Tax=Agromyces mediolanus TaxID=41986 RepID=UPI00203B895F|nr:HAMP domain-containing sensor histidine kinase [Agromyces mediolanus]MCM3657914.1 HAMP domain-containing histidine kinase [Agromyces mediolanus]